MIEKLTKEQIARFPEFVERWTKIGLCTDPADRPKAEAAIIDCYKYAGLAPPKKIVWCGSPLSQGLTRAIILDKKLTEGIGKSVRDSVQASVRASVQASVQASVGASVWASVGDSVYGQHDANWLAWIAYFREMCALKSQTEKCLGLDALAKSAGWALPHQNICWVSERHNILERDERGRLHNLVGPAVMYPDGWSIYSVHGVRVPGWIIEEKQKLNAQVIDKEQNAEIRRVMIEIFGQEKYLIEGKAEKIHKDEFGTLWRKQIEGDEELVMVEVLNSTPEPDNSFKTYFLRVPPTVKTAHEAVAWSFQKEPKQYSPAQES